MGALANSIDGARCQPYDFMTDEEAIGAIDDPAALVAIGECEFDEGRLPESRSAFEKAAQRDPSRLEAWHGLLKLFFHSSASAVALGEVRDIAAWLDEIAPGDPLTSCLSALFLVDGGEAGRADRLIADALMGYHLNGSPFSSTPLCLGYYLAYSTASDAKADVGTALELFEEASLLEPQSAAPWRYRGSVLGRLGLCDEAVSAMTTSLDLYPTSGQSWRNLADVYFYNCRDAEFLAELALMRAMECQAPHASDLFTLGQIVQGYGDLPRAEEHFLEAIRLEPAEPTYLEHLMHFYLEQGRDDEALTIWPDLVELVDSPAEFVELARRLSDPIYDRLTDLIIASGWTYACTGEVVSAWREMSRLAGVILTIDEDDPYALYLRGRSGWRLSFCCPDAEGDDVDGAVSDLNGAVANSSACGEAFLAKLYNERGLALMRMSGRLFASGDVEGAMRIAALARGDFTRVIEGGPKKGEATIAAREAVEATLSLGWLHYANGEYDAARRQFSDVADERIWPSPPTSSKERAEALRALGLIAYRGGKQMFHKAEASGKGGEYEAAAGELEAAVRSFAAAADIEQRDAGQYLGTAVREGQGSVEVRLLNALDWYLSKVYDSERLDTRMNWGFAEYFLGRALKERPNPDTPAGISHLDKAIELFGRVLEVARDNPEMLRFRGSALIARGSYHAGVDDIIASVKHGTRFVDNALAKAVVAVRELIALTDNASYTDYDNQARRLFRRLPEETDVCGKRLKKEVLDLRGPLLDHAKRCDPQFFSDLFSCIERYGGEGRRLVRSLKRGCPKR